jgi:hypothetical protein
MSKNSARSNYTNLMEWLKVNEAKRPKTLSTRKPSEWYEAELAKQPKF